MSLNDQTPASVAGIKFPFRNWKDICEQPFEKTARIPIKSIVGIEPGTTITDTLKRKPVAMLHKRKVRKTLRRVGGVSVTPSLIQVRRGRQIN